MTLDGARPDLQLVVGKAVVAGKDELLRWSMRSRRAQAVVEGKASSDEGRGRGHGDLKLECERGNLQHG